MNTYTLTPEERFNLILECRNSGLTDYQWCKQKGISTNTLYRWINKFRQNGYPNIPKVHCLNRQKCLEYILEHRPSAEMTDEELSLLAPWNKDVQETCEKCDH